MKLTEEIRRLVQDTVILELRKQLVVQCEQCGCRVKTELKEYKVRRAELYGQQVLIITDPEVNPRIRELDRLFMGQGNVNWKLNEEFVVSRVVA